MSVVTGSDWWQLVVVVSRGVLRMLVVPIGYKVDCSSAAPMMLSGTISTVRI